MTAPQHRAADYVALRTFVVNSQAALFFSLLDRQAIDPDRFFSFSRTLADGLRQTSAHTSGGPIAANAMASAADMLGDLEAMIRNMATLPAGAGRA